MGRGRRDYRAIVLSNLRDDLRRTQVLPFKFQGWANALDEAGCPDAQLDL
jgi:hypothetical protein